MLNLLTIHSLRTKWPQNVGSRVVGQWDSSCVFDWHPKDGVTVHFKRAIAEWPHGINPGLENRKGKMWTFQNKVQFVFREERNTSFSYDCPQKTIHLRALLSSLWTRSYQQHVYRLKKTLFHRLNLKYAIFQKYKA